MSLKVLHLNYSDTKGGAAIAVNRIHECLKIEGVISKILVATKTNDDNFIGPSSTLTEIKYKIFEALNRKVLKLEKKVNYDSNSYNLFPNNIIKLINSLDFDLINFHWIGNNFLRIKDIKKIQKPIVWTLHDMWPYCGSEHYTFTNRFIDGYKKENKFHQGLDIERYCWEQKLKNYPKKINVIATSEWQFKNAKKSILFKNAKVDKIGYPLDFNFWKPINKMISRKILNIPENKNVILIGSENLNSKRKGYKKIMKILESKKDINNPLILTFGENKIESNIENINFKNIKPNSYDLKLLYSCADVYLSPSLQESFGQTSLESISCLTPVVCFDSTGTTDIIKHKLTGYISKENDLEDFYQGIKWVIENLKNNITFDEIVYLKEKFSYNHISKSYISLYKNVINKTKF
jgi:glycosyltransferase involved in cell wall biosynthesis